jgi:two-component system, cell cycle sensor histidine kinase PleC
MTIAAANPWLPDFLQTRRAVPWIGANLAVAAGYFLLATIVSRFFAEYGLFPAPIWLPTSVAMVAAIAGGFGLAGGIFAGAFLANFVLFDTPVLPALAIATSNTAGPMVAALLLRRHRPTGGMFASFKGVSTFLLYATLLSPAISGLGGALTVTAGKGADLATVGSIWIGWWLTDSGGTLFLAVTAILWLRLEREPDTRASSTSKISDRIVWAAVAVAAIAIFQVQLAPDSVVSWAYPFLLVVPAAWITLRMSLRAAQTLVSLVAIVACAGTVAGLGPFQTGAGNGLQLACVLVVSLAMTALTIAALAAERRKAEDASQIKSMFLATASHELRTPLNGIIGYSSMLAEGERIAPEKVREFARTIEQSGQHLLQLINELLDLTKIEAGRYDLRNEKVELAALIGAAIDTTLGLSQPKNIDVQAPAPGAAVVLGDRRALLQILLNLLSNAVKFTPSGGRVDLAVVRTRDGGLELRVRDNGLGIPAAALETVFVPFERLRDRTAPDVPGTGLGLAISRGLAELHGGKLHLESQLGVGTSAVLTLPPTRVAV